ncbi:MAG: hypothetical protein ACTHN5_11440 [Phycisphaerae bacterium]
MANTGLKAACLGAIGVATMWQGQQAKADIIYTGATVTSPVDLTHAHALYTSNVSVVQTDNTTPIAMPVGYANYEVGSVGVTGLTASTAGTFDLNLADAPAVPLQDGQSTAGVVHSLVLVGLNGNQQIVVSNSLGSNPNWAMLFGSSTYDTVVNALESDSDAEIGALVAKPSGTTLPTGYVFGEGYTGSSFNPFGLYTFTDETTSTAISVEDPTGSYSTPVQGSFALPTPTPEPASAVLFGAPVVAWALGRRRRV